MPNLPPLILTLQLDAATFAVLDGLRTQHFPPERNLVPAHLTLFHALPGAHEEELGAQLRTLAAGTLPLALALPAVQLLGRGVAVAVESPALSALRAALARS